MIEVNFLKSSLKSHDEKILFLKFTHGNSLEYVITHSELFHKLNACIYFCKNKLTFLVEWIL